MEIIDRKTLPENNVLNQPFIKKFTYMSKNDSPEEKRRKRREYMRAYRKRYKNTNKDYDKKYREKHKGDIARWRQNRVLTPEQKQKQKEYFRKYYEKNKKTMIANSTRYYHRNKDFIKQLTRTKYNLMSEEQRIKLSIRNRLIYEKKCFEKGLIPCKYNPRTPMDFEEIKTYLNNSEILNLIEKKEQLDAEKRLIYQRKKDAHDKLKYQRKLERDYRVQCKKFGNISRKIFTHEKMP